jgi:hypothetical protein
MAITRTAMIDDDGSGTTGTIINNAWKTELYNQIDGAVGGYSEGAWTPTDLSGAALTFPTAVGGYVLLGPLLFGCAQIAWPATANAATCLLSLPVITAGPAGWTYPGGLVGYTSFATPLTVMLQGTSLYLFKYGGALVTNAEMSGKEVRLEVIYRFK